MSSLDYQSPITNFNYQSESKTKTVMPQSLAGSNLHKLATQGIIDPNYWPSLSFLFASDDVGHPWATTCYSMPLFHLELLDAALEVEVEGG